MITCIHIIYPDAPLKLKPEDEGLSIEAYKKGMKYCTSSRDGTVKIWAAIDLKHQKEIKVTDGYWVTCITNMTKSKYLVAASANRMISFYDLGATNNEKPCSRIEDLVGIPLCMEYYRW